VGGKDHRGAVGGGELHQNTVYKKKICHLNKQKQVLSSLDCSFFHLLFFFIFLLNLSTFNLDFDIFN